MLMMRFAAASVAAVWVMVGWIGDAWAGAGALVAGEDSAGLVALFAAMVSFWLYFRVTTEDQA